MITTKELHEAISTLGVAQSFAALPPDEARALASAVKSRFVTGNPRVWWLGFGQSTTSTTYETPAEWAALLAERLASVESCLFIPEPEDGEAAVYRVRPEAAIRVLGECAFFEYYFADESLTWILADTDHNQLIFVRTGPKMSGG